MISTLRGVVLNICFITFWSREGVVGRRFLTNDTTLNEKEVTLRVDVIYIICWKGQLSQYDFLKETLFQLLYWKEKLTGQINKT